MKVIAIVTAGLMLTANGALAGDFDLAKGEKAFKKCATCHAVGGKAKNKVGPELNGVLGRPVASVEGYKYSTGEGSLTAWGEGQVWDVTILTAYLAKPKDVVKKTKMAFAGLKKEEDIANVIAFLAQFNADGSETDPAAVLEANGGE